MLHWYCTVLLSCSANFIIKMPEQPSENYWVQSVSPAQWYDLRTATAEMFLFHVLHRRKSPWQIQNVLIGTEKNSSRRLNRLNWKGWFWPSFTPCSDPVSLLGHPSSATGNLLPAEGVCGCDLPEEKKNVLSICQPVAFLFGWRSVHHEKLTTEKHGRCHWCWPSWNAAALFITAPRKCWRGNGVIESLRLEKASKII